jgi:hypothetical protein
LTHPLNVSALPMHCIVRSCVHTELEWPQGLRECSLPCKGTDEPYEENRGLKEPLIKPRRTTEGLDGVYKI